MSDWKDSKWYEILQEERQKDYFKNLEHFLKTEEKNGKTIFPPKKDIFNAFKYSDLNEIKCVILGMSPYHNKGQAHGLAFSTLDEKRPPSLQNIFKEVYYNFYSDEINYGEFAQIFTTNNLENWAKQGVLLLNTALTVEKGNPSSHTNIGWIYFVRRVLNELNQNENKKAFLLWGNHAKGFENYIDDNYHLVLKSSHPSPFSAKNFFYNYHFKKANEFLENNKRNPIRWTDL